MDAWFAELNAAANDVMFAVFGGVGACIPFLLILGMGFWLSRPRQE